MDELEESRRRTRAHLTKLLTIDNPKSLERTETLLRVLGAFSSENYRNIVDTFTAATKILVARQNRLNKNQLKPKEVRSALQLAAYHYEQTRELHATQDGLNMFLGKNVNEDQALSYFRNHVSGKVKDAHGMEITIAEDGSCYLYKEDGSGRHVVDGSNFQLMRAKRLPWIIPTIRTTKEVYKRRSDRDDWMIFGYAQAVRVPIQSGSVANYFFVIARKKHPDAPVKFVTAYHMENHEDFLKRIEEFEPFHGFQKA